MNRIKLSPGWALLKNCLSKSQWRQLRRKNNSDVLLDFCGPFLEKDLEILKSEGFRIHHISYPGGWGTYITAPSEAKKI